MHYIQVNKNKKYEEFIIRTKAKHETMEGHFKMVKEQK